MVSLRGVVTTGLGQGGRFMAVDWVREGIRRLVGFDPYPGTLNVRLVEPAALHAWRRISHDATLRLDPPPPETCGARLVLATLMPDVAAAIVVPDVTGHGDDLLELVAAVHVRNHLGLQEHDPVTLQVPTMLAPGIR